MRSQADIEWTAKLQPAIHIGRIMHFSTILIRIGTLKNLGNSRIDLYPQIYTLLAMKKLTKLYLEQ